MGRRTEALEVQVSGVLRGVLTGVGVLGAATLTGCGEPNAGYWWDEAAEHVGEEATVCGPAISVITDVNDAGEKTGFINIGADYPDPNRFTFVVYDEDLGNFDPQQHEYCGTGTIQLYEGVPQIETTVVFDEDAPPPDL